MLLYDDDFQGGKTIRTSQPETLVKPNPGTYVLHSSHRQLSGVQDFIEFLNWSRLLHSFSLLGNISFQTIGPKLRNDLSPFSQSPLLASQKYHLT